ncbi:Flavin-containing monooxygenase FMO GS-OX-like 9 [Glycine soja]
MPSMNMATPPSYLPPNSPASLESTSRRTRQCTRLIRLTIRHLDQLRLVVHVNPSVRKALGPLKENFHTNLGTIAQYKSQFEIPKVSNSRKKSKSVCVTRARPSGLLLARVRKEGHKVVVSEQNHDIGGQWLYDPNVQEEDPLGRDPWLKMHSNIYESLTLTSPRQIMGSTNFLFLVKKGGDTMKFPSHTKFLSSHTDH